MAERVESGATTWKIERRNGRAFVRNRDGYLADIMVEDRWVAPEVLARNEAAVQMIAAAPALVDALRRIEALDGTTHPLGFCGDNHARCVAIARAALASLPTGGTDDGR